MIPLKTDTLRSGGAMFDSVRLRCLVQASRKGDEAIVTLVGVPGVVIDPAFFVDPILVDPSPPPSSAAEGSVQVLLLEERDDELVIEVPGEPASYGPKLLVPRSLAV